MRLWLGFLKEVRPSWPVWVDLQDAGVGAALFADDHPLVSITDTLWRLRGQISARPSEQWASDSRAVVAHWGTPRSDAGLERLARAATVHLIGGGYLNSHWQQNLILALLSGASGEIHGQSVFATGQGLSPLVEEDRLLLQAALVAFDYVESRETAESAPLPDGVDPGVDDAFLGFHPRLRELWADHRSETPPRFMLVLQGDLLADPDRRKSVLDTALEQLRSAGWVESDELGVLEAVPPEDAWCVSELNGRGIPVRFYPFLDLWLNGLPITDGQYWVSTRFHFHLLVAGSGVSGTAIVISDDYYLPKHRSLTEIGTGWRLVDIGGDVIEEGSAATTVAFKARALGLARVKWRLASSLYPADRAIRLPRPVRRSVPRRTG